MNVFSVYEIASGRLTGQRIGASGDVNPDWIPDGCGVILGEWDHERWAVNHETGKIEETTPPPMDWRLRKFQAQDAAMEEISVAEADQSRPMREILEAMLMGASPPEEAVSRLAEIKIRIETARLRYARLKAAQSEEEMNSILA